MRYLKKEEKELINYLLNNSNQIISNLDDLLVEEMKDGGMRSLHIINSQKERSERRFGKCISEKQFLDSDNVPIIVSLNLDEAGDLFELDIWKVDFSTVLKYPNCENLDSNMI